MDPAEADAAHGVIRSYRETLLRGTALTRTVTRYEVGGRPGELVGHGGIDFARRRSFQVVDLGSGRSMEIRKVGLRTYRRTSGADGPVEAWQMVDLAGCALRGAGRVSVLGGDPDRVAASLAAATRRVVRTGRAPVSGRSTTEYRMVVDLVRMGRETGVDTGPLRRRLEGGALHAFRLWVDDDGLLRLERSDLDLDLAETSGPGRTAVSLEFVSYGDPVEVDEPHDDVVDVTAEALAAAS